MTKEQVFKFIKEQKTAMISSIDAEGFPNTKAMLSPRKMDGNDFYFSTNTSSMRVAQYSAYDSQKKDVGSALCVVTYIGKKTY